MVAARGGGVERCGVARCESVRACAQRKQAVDHNSPGQKDLCERCATAFLATQQLIALRGDL